MKFFIELLKITQELAKISKQAQIVESWGNLTMEGDYHNDGIDLLCQLMDHFSSAGFTNSCSVSVGSEQNINRTELEDYKGNNLYKAWKININKLSLISTDSNNCRHNFFLYSEHCEKWIDKLNPLLNQNPLNSDLTTKIIVQNITVPIGGEKLMFLPADIKFESQEFAKQFELPKIDKIKENVHFVADFQIDFDPNIYCFSSGDFSSNLAKSLLKISTIVFASIIVDEFYNYNKVVINGLKSTELSLSSATTEYNYSFNQALMNLVYWMYEDRTTTRKKLFYDRLTLELKGSESLLDSLQSNLTTALSQAKARFNFVILDRKDAYVKELKDLLKDLRTQSDLYSLKIRTLLSNFLRDALAAIVLIGFTIFTKFTDNMGLDKHQLLYYVFYGLGIYNIVSIVFQAIVDWTDISITKTELTYWKKASNELLPEAEFDKHLKDSLGNRRNSLMILYPVIGLLYIALAVACFKYPGYFEQLIKK